jgi:hypothetical protein
MLSFLFSLSLSIRELQLLFKKYIKDLEEKEDCSQMFLKGNELSSLVGGLRERLHMLLAWV